MNVNRAFGQHGLGRAALIFFLAVFGTVVYCGYRIFPFFYYFEEIQGMLESQAAKASVFTDEQIRKVIWERVKELEIPLDEKEDIQINRAEGRIIIDFSYQEVFDIEIGGKTYDIHVFDFNPHVDRQI